MHKVAGRIPSSEALHPSSPETQGVLFEDVIISREEAITRCFTPRPGCEHLKPTAEKKTKIGGGMMLWLNPTTSFICPQIRDGYKLSHYENIGRMICDDPDGQLQNCGVALNDAEHIEQFLADMNAYFDSDITLDDIQSHHIGEHYVTTIFGHNRQLGIASANLRSSGHPDKGVLMQAKAFINPPFWRVISAQAKENTGQNPEMWDRARSIVMYRNLRLRDGNPPTQDEIAKIFGVHEDQIWRAERYDSLPVAIKTLVMDRLLTYSSAIEFHQLGDYYSEEDIILLAKKLASRRASGPQVMEEIKKRLHVGGLTPEARHLVEEGVMTLPQAELLSKLSRYVTEDALNRAVEWISVVLPTTEQTRSYVMNIISELQGGQLSVFNEFDEGVIERAQAEVAAYQASQQAARIQAVIANLNHHTHGLRVAIGSGLIGDAIGGKPISRNANYALTEQLLGALDNIRTAEANELRQAVISIQNCLVSSSNGIGAQVSSALYELAELMELELSQNAENQRRNRQKIVERFGSLAGGRSVAVQEGLF